MGNEDEECGSKVYYVDYRTHFTLFGMNVGNAEQDLINCREEEIKNDPGNFQGVDPTKYNPWDCHERGQGRDWTHNHRFYQHETFQWLFYTGGQVSTGPEQLWVERSYSEASEHEAREPLSTFKLSAGSVDLESYGKYCYQGGILSSLMQLAALIPGLWRWRCISLARFEFFNVSDEPSDNPRPWQTITTQPVQPHANSPDTFKVLQDWLRKCKSSHSYCKKGSFPDFDLPRRLIHVGPSSGSQSPHLHVRDREEIVQYAILSHCQGRSGPNSSDSLKLYSHNLDSLQHSIDFDELAESFQDAIIITRSLGLHYLWIDALCIIQDSPQDRGKETSKRRQYYSGSELCIAATSSPHAQHGILHPRILATDSVRLAGEAESLGVRPVAEDVITVIERSSLRDRRPHIANQPLQLQGHALLERLYSMRIVHFIEQQMVWQCQTCLVGEDGQVGADRDRFSCWPSKQPFDLALGPLLREITGPNENEHYRYPDMTLNSPVEGHTGVKYSLDEALMDTRWYRLIEAYSGLSLESSADLLPFLSPFTNDIQQRTKAIYHAGLWAMDGQIPFRSLLWYSKQRNTRANNGSPSWTWSSVLGPVIHPAQMLYRLDYPGVRIEWIPPEAKKQYRVILYDQTDSQIKVSSLTTNPATSDVFGQVHGGELRITGLVHSYTGAEKWQFAAERGTSAKVAVRNLDDLPADQITRTRTRFPLNTAKEEDANEFEEKEDQEEDKEAQQKDQKDVNDFTLTEYLDTEDPSEVQWEKQKHILLLIAAFREELDGFRKLHGTSEDSIQFIILRQSVGGDPERYVRIGTAHLKRKDRDFGWGAVGLHGVRSAYIEANGWKRQPLVLV
ncbi:MAG: hypothetical protein L6R40_008457 [Gallowayella cf. fulva]|nr:MAG: hypothetical protein L6R40_008457 [Xanthomendoza cf. fulva]